MKYDETIINEEIVKFLNESNIVSDDRFRFKQRINNASFYGYEVFTTEFDSDITESDIVVNWRISFGLNIAGIENFIIDVEGVEGNFLLQLFDKHTDELKQESPKNIDEYQWKYIINGDAAIQKGGSLYINNLSFDFKNKTCTIIF